MAEAESANTMFQNSFVKAADGDYALKVVGGTAGQIVQATIPAAARASSVVANGKVAAPAAAAAIATTASLAIGTWDIVVVAFISGTTAPADIDNMQLKQNAINLGVVICPVAGTTGASGLAILKNRIQVTVAGAASVVAIANATAASLYVVAITATRVL